MTEEFRTEKLGGAERQEVRDFLAARGVRVSEDAEYTVRAYENGVLLGCGSLAGSVLKYIAVDAAAEGEGLCAALVSHLVTEAIHRGRQKLFLYTKPENGRLFRSLGFYPIAESGAMLMMENRKKGISGYLASLPRAKGHVGAVVMHANPFTLGHRYLLQQAAARADSVYVFIVSEENALFPAADRFELVRRGSADIPGLILCSSEEYLVSRATFPDYFLKEGIDPDAARADLDIVLFGSRIAPALGIRERFVGSEPFSQVTADYNRRMAELLPGYGVTLTELSRKDGISASTVRALMCAGDLAALKKLVPETTYDYIAARESGGKDLVK